MTTKTLTKQAIQFFSVIGREHLISNLNNLKRSAEYANNALNAGGLAEWEAKEYSAIIYDNMSKHGLEVERMNSVAKQLA